MAYLNSRVFNEQDYIVNDEDFMRLNAARPFGLSGHLRVRNEAVTLRACLDSCLPFLDELIVTYNDSSDETEEILLEYVKRYPHKIRLYWYPLTWGSLRGTVQPMPLGHLAQFYNFGYTKVRFAYYVKIDGDQIYFTDKMIFVRDLLQKYSNPKLSSADIPALKDGESSVFEHCERIVAKALLSEKKYTLILGGLNACYCNDELYMSACCNLDNRGLFNGFSGDAFIVRPSFQKRYFLQGNFMEIFPHVGTQCIPLGICWVHAHMAKQGKQIYEGPVIPLQLVHAYSWDEVYTLINTEPTQDKKLHNYYKNLGRQFWDKDIRTFLTKEFYHKLLEDVLHLTREHFKKRA